MLNSISVQGRMTRDPELRYTQSQTPVASFTVACERDNTDQRGKREVDFIDCVSWKKAGEFVSKYFHKGDMIVVNGSLQIREWTDKEGNKRRNAEVVTSSVHFCGNNNSGKQAEIQADPQFEDVPDEEDGELPF